MCADVGSRCRVTLQCAVCLCCFVEFCMRQGMEGRGVAARVAAEAILTGALTAAAAPVAAVVTQQQCPETSDSRALKNMPTIRLSFLSTSMKSGYYSRATSAFMLLSFPESGVRAVAKLIKRQAQQCPKTCVCRHTRKHANSHISRDSLFFQPQ